MKLKNKNSYIVSIIQVNEFLRELKKILQSKDCELDILPKKKGEDSADPYTTENTMLSLDYDTEDVKEQLMLLSQNQYIETISDNIDNNPHFWVFGKKINSQEIYIKVKIRSTDKVFCVSFHYARFPLKAIPYK